MEDIKVTEEKERRKKKSRKVKREKNAGINLCYGMHFFLRRPIVCHPSARVLLCSKQSDNVLR